MDADKFAKLPKWAQHEIQRLGADVKSLRNDLERTLRPADDNYPSYGDYDELRGMGLPCRTVRFAKYGISVRVGRNGVEIHGDGALMIAPHVTNVITITSDRTDCD